MFVRGKKNVFFFIVQRTLLTFYKYEIYFDKKNIWAPKYYVTITYSSFDCRWNEGLRDGEGEYFFPSSTESNSRRSYRGSWKLGQVIGKGEFRFEDGYTLRGEYAETGWISFAL